MHESIKDGATTNLSPVKCKLVLLNFWPFKLSIRKGLRSSKIRWMIRWNLFHKVGFLIKLGVSCNIFPPFLLSFSSLLFFLFLQFFILACSLFSPCPSYFFSLFIFRLVAKCDVNIEYEPNGRYEILLRSWHLYVFLLLYSQLVSVTFIKFFWFVVCIYIVSFLAIVGISMSAPGFEDVGCLEHYVFWVDRRPFVILCLSCWAPLIFMVGPSST